MEAILKGGLSAFIAYSSHYASVKFYSFACTPDGIWGYLTGFVSTGSPVCQASLGIVKNTQISYSNLILTSLTRILVDMLAPDTKTE